MKLFLICTLIASLACFSYGDVGSIITRSFFYNMLKHTNDPACEAHGFYSYDAFIAAANSFNGFGTTGNNEAQKRELAAFFGQTSHETNGGWPTAPDGPYAWGYCFLKESSPQEPKYYGRGPIQLTHDYNYQQAGNAIHADLINNPDLVITDPVIAFKTAIWFWMTRQGNKPSCHEVIMGWWNPSPSDRSAGRIPGYGLITNIINGGLECGNGPNSNSGNRIGYYKRYCDILGITYGGNLNCRSQQHF